MEAGRSEPPPPTLSAAPNKSILKTFLFFPAVSNRFHPRQRPSIRLKNKYVFNWQVHAGQYLPCSHTVQTMKSSQNRSIQCPMEMNATAAGRSLRQSEVYQLRERWDKPSPRHRSYRQRRPPSRTARSRKRPSKRQLTTS